jgi:protein-glutamine gamma-glutamyltransferase
MNFEQNLRREICDAAYQLNESGMEFAVFSDTRCNTDYWSRTSNGGFLLKTSVNPAESIRDIFGNGHAYATECATAMGIVYYKAVLEVYGEKLFNKTFASIYLMDWDIRDPLLSKTGRISPVPKLLIGDRGYFANPDHDPELPQWQGENVIVLEDDMYYGHGIGLHNADYIINALNSRRKSGDSRSAYLMNQAGRPDFLKLESVMRKSGTITVWREFPSAVSVMSVEGKRGSLHFV